MIRLMSFIVFCGFSLSLNTAHAEDRKQMAVDLVNKAIEFYKAEGKDKAFAEISTPKGKFSKENGELYVFVYDMSGTVVAHGQNPQQIGTNSLQAKDKDGKFYVKERIELVKKSGEGWQDYMFKEPKTGKAAAKTSYIKKVDNYIFGCGIYK